MTAEVKVVDASVIVAIAFVEPDCERAAEMLTGGTLIAPALLDIEFANVCLIKQRKFALTSEAIRMAWELRDDFSIELFGVDPHGVYRLASATGLTAYDACYLWLAKVRAADLMCDRGAEPKGEVFFGVAGISRKAQNAIALHGVDFIGTVAMAPLKNTDRVSTSKLH